MPVVELFRKPRAQVVKAGQGYSQSAEAVAPLLRARRRCRWPQRLLLQPPVHALVSPILFRVARLDALVADPEVHPPRIGEPRQAADAAARERGPLSVRIRSGKPYSWNTDSTRQS